MIRLFTVFLHASTQNSARIYEGIASAYPQGWIIAWMIGLLLVFGGAHMAYG